MSQLSKVMKTYLKAIIILIIYVIVTRGLFISMIFYPKAEIALLVEGVVAGISGIAFLYFFEHEDLFKFARVIRDKKRRVEERLLDNFLRFGAIGATVIIGYIAGPLFCSLTVYLLLSNFRYKYLLTLLVSSSSIVVALAIARGILHLALRLI